MTVDELNAADEADARRELSACCAARAWVDAILAARPFSSLAALQEVSRRATAALDDGGLAEALAAHPRIGERHRGCGASARWSAQEQSGVESADRVLRDRLVRANIAYERRFGHVYLVCATGRTAQEMVELCERRLRGEPGAERAVVLAELAKINEIRLNRLLGTEVSA